MDTLKTILAIVGLILIGFVSGFYAHRQMSKHFIKNVVEMRQPRGFQDHLFDRIEATEPQRQELLPIVESYSAKIATHHKAFRKTRHELIDSMHTAIKPKLTAGQIEKLDQFSRRFRDRNGRFKGQKRKELK